MKIGIDAHYVGVRDGGNERYCENVLRRLPAVDGDTFYVFSYGGAAESRVGNGKLQHVPLRRRSVSWQRAVELPRHARALKLDVLHVPYNVLPVGRARKVVTIYDLSFLHYPDAHSLIERARLSLLTPAAARGTHHVITISELSRREIISRYRVPEERVTVAPPAVDRAMFSPRPDPAADVEWRARWQINEGYLLHVGTLQPRKNVGVLVEAVSRLRRRGMNLKLVLVGRAERGAPAVWEQVERLGLHDAVYYVGRLPDPLLAAAYRGAHALVLPSLYEGFGMPVLEAMSCGCPVISSRSGALPETCGSAALLFEPRSAVELEENVERLLGDAALRDDLIARGFANCERFSWDRTAALIAAGYRTA